MKHALTLLILTSAFFGCKKYELADTYLGTMTAERNQAVIADFDSVVVTIDSESKKEISFTLSTGTITRVFTADIERSGSLDIQPYSVTVFAGDGTGELTDSGMTLEFTETVANVSTTFHFTGSAL